MHTSELSAGTISAPPRRSGAGAADARKTGTSRQEPDLRLPDDIVTLSSSADQKPSVPVTTDEKQALLAPDPQYAFSIYG